MFSGCCCRSVRFPLSGHKNLSGHAANVDRDRDCDRDTDKDIRVTVLYKF